MRTAPARAEHRPAASKRRLPICRVIMSNVKRKPRLGLLLPNQGIVFGATTVRELIELAELADESEVFDAVFVGDNRLAKPRLESITTLSALAVRTRRVKLGTACMASFPLRDPIVLAAQWGALDNLSEGRALLVACIGGGGGKAQMEGQFNSEYAAFGIRPTERAARLEEGIQVLRALWSQDPASHHGRFFNFDEIAVRPAPIQNPPPIWIANNPHVFQARPDIVRRTVERVGRFADGWMTVKASPEQFHNLWRAIRESAKAHGRDSEKLESCLYFSLNINSDRDRAFEESKRFLDEYYSADHSREQVDQWAVYGPPEHCVDALHAYSDAGVDIFCLRFTAYDQMGQLNRFLQQVAPEL